MTLCIQCYDRLSVKPDQLCSVCWARNNTPPDGIAGTDGTRPSNVRPLFADQPSAAGLGPQPGVIAMLADALEEAKQGKVSGALLICFHANGDSFPMTAGKIVYSSMITELETMKLKAILMQEPFLTGGK